MAYTPDQVKSLIDQAELLNEKLKNVVASMKEVAEAKAFGNMAENLENFGKILNKYDQALSKQTEITSLINQQRTSLLGQNQVMDDYVEAIRTSVSVRRKLGEETNILASYQSKLQDAQISGDQARINRAQAALDLQYDQVEALRQQLQSYDLIVGDQATLAQLVGDVNAEALFQLALTSQQREIYDDYVRNHKLQVDFLNQALTTEEQIRAKKEAQLKQDESILKAEEQKLENIAKNSFLYGQVFKTATEIWNTLGLQKITLGAVIKGAFDLNKIFVDNAKQLGTTREVTKQIAGDVADQSAKAGTLASYGTQDVQTRKNALEAQAALNKSLGTAAMYSSERLRDQNFLTKIMGLEVEDAVKVQQLSLVSGKTNKEIVDSVNNQVIGLGKQTGIYLDNRKVLADVAKVSGQLASQYKNNPELIAQAVVKVQQLGMNLELAATSSNKLLNFSDSLAKELEAELLTGKAINLEQARYYALMGDSAKAAEELMANIGGLEEFNKLNVLQQRAYAEAIGMSADELANSLKTQELLKQTGDNSLEALNERRRIAAEEGKSEEFLQELRRAGTSEEMIANQAQLASQDKMNALVEKTLELFSTMVEPMTHLVGKAVDFVDALGGAKTLLSIIG